MIVSGEPNHDNGTYNRTFSVPSLTAKGSYLSPFGPSIGLTSRVCKTEAIVINSDSPASQRPGQILPKVKMCHLFLGIGVIVSLPSPRPKRVVCWIAYGRVQFPIEDKAFREELFRFGVCNRVMGYGPIMHPVLGQHHC